MELKALSIKKAHLVTTAVMPQGDGIYTSRTISAEEFVELVNQAANSGSLYSYIRYPQIALFLSNLCDFALPTNMVDLQQLDNEEVLLIAQLKNSVDDTKHFQYTLSVEDFEFRVVQYRANQ